MSVIQSPNLRTVKIKQKIFGLCYLRYVFWLTAKSGNAIVLDAKLNRILDITKQYLHESRNNRVTSVVLGDFSFFSSKVSFLPPCIK